MLEDITKEVTRRALVNIIVNVSKKEDDTCKAVELIELLYINKPNPETAKTILNILNPNGGVKVASTQ
jgi:hypothetical protein